MNKMKEKYIAAAFALVALTGAGFAVHYSIRNNAALARAAELQADVDKLTEANAEKGLSNTVSDTLSNSDTNSSNDGTEGNTINDKSDDQNAVQRVEMSASRKAADDALITELCRTAFTWSNSTEYNSAREQMITRFGIDPNGQFLTKYFVPLVKNEDLDSRNVNGTFVSLDTQLLTIEGDTYSYVGKVTAQSLDRNGAAAQSEAMIYYETNPDGTIKDLQGFIVRR